MAIVGSEIVGHIQIRTKIRASIEQNRMPSSILFRGPEGVGKLKVAWSLAQDLLCEQNMASACGRCPSCLRVFKRQHENLLIIDSSESNIKLDSVINVLEFIRLRLVGKARIIIINDAHKLNVQASNRLLKTIEEPPPYTHFIFITSQDTNLPLTIRSRCQMVNFGPLSETELKQVIDAPQWMYHSAQGRLDLLSRWVGDSDEKRKDAFQLFKGYMSHGRSYLFSNLPVQVKEKDAALEVLRFFAQFVRDLWVMKYSNGQLIHQDYETEYKQLDLNKDLDLFWKELNEMRSSIEMNADRLLSFENLWFKLHQGAV